MAAYPRGLSASIFLSLIVLFLLVTTPPAATHVPVSFGTKDHFHAFADPLVANASELRKRDEYISWQQALTYGSMYLSMLSGARQQSEWSTIQQLMDNGWSISAPMLEGGTQDEYGGPEGPYSVLHIRQSQGRRVVATQDNHFRNCYNDDNRPTDAFFDQVYNVAGRAIVGLNNASPLFKLRDANPGTPNAQLTPHIPRVFRLSDVTWILWADQAQQRALSPGSLKYIFKNFITTQSTEGVIEMAANPSRTRELFEKPWPGYRYAKGTEEFQALLGTPHGKGVVWVIIQHPNELPNKDIESITTFTVGPDYHLLFTLTD